MPIGNERRRDHRAVNPRTAGGHADSHDLAPLAGTKKPPPPEEPRNLVNVSYTKAADSEPSVETRVLVDEPAVIEPKPERHGRQKQPLSEGARAKEKKRAKQTESDRVMLHKERWLARNGHFLTFIGLYLFSILVLFRPYELVASLGFLSATAFYFALATLIIYVPSQIATEANLTILSTDVKAILAMTLIALITIPIAKDAKTAWDTFNEPFIKAVVIFVVLVNVVRTRKRLMAIMWLSLSIGVYLAYTALDLYMQGKFKVEDYRVGVEVGGMFGNPNDMALHFVMMTPIVFALGIAARSKFWRLVYWAMGALFIGANMVTYSRGGFLGLIATMAVLAWKLGRRYRLNVTIASILIGGTAMVAAPGNYGLRMLSIFIPGLDAVGSSDQRWELLNRSLLVTARNPWGIGIGCFPIVGIHDHQTHNAFTQVSSELGVLGLVAYLVFMISPFRKLSAIERTLFDADAHTWFYYMSIGLQASIVGYWVTSFFASVAYNWFIYYLIAYAVAMRRIYRIETEKTEEKKQVPALRNLEASASRMIGTAEQAAFWICLALLGYVYVGYPLLVFVVSLLFPKPVRKGDIQPAVTILITAYNEEAAIRSKLENTLAIDYPAAKLEILVASDGSTDGTDEIVGEFAGQGVKLFRQDGRVGKTMTQNNAVAEASGEIILFSDATTHYDRDVFRWILPAFADKTVGCVAGRLVYVDDESTTVGRGAQSYWSYETFLKLAESQACSLIGASGCLYAVRRDAYQPMYAEACSDFLICTMLYRQGMRSVFAPDAVCFEHTNRSASDELKMRVRVISQTFTDLWRNRDMLNPIKSGFFAVELISHKLLRYAVPIILFALLVSTIFLARNSVFFTSMATAQIVFYLLALAGFVMERAGKRLSLLAMPLYFVLANFASVVGFYKFLRGEKYATWEPIRSKITL